MSEQSGEPPFPPREDWELPPNYEPDQPLGLTLLAPSEENFGQFCQGLLYADMQNPGTLYRKGAVPDMSAIHEAYMSAKAVCAFVNTKRLAFSGGMLSLMKNGSGYISSVYCTNEHSHHGFGRKVIAALLQRALELNIETVHLYVFNENERAREIYERAGFYATSGLSLAGSSTVMTIRGREYIEAKILELLA